MPEPSDGPTAAASALTAPQMLTATARFDRGKAASTSASEEGVSMALGTDSHAQIDLLEDARELEYHQRLQRMERAVLAGTAPTEGGAAALAARLFDCATINGAKSIGSPVGILETGRSADFFTVDLDDPSIAGASPDNLLASVVFSLSRAAVREVVVGGKQIVSEGRHQEQEKIVERFSKLQAKLWT